MNRRRLKLELLDPRPGPKTHPVPREAGGAPEARPLSHDDGPVLAALMFAAYEHTIDGAGETPDDAVAEVKRTFEGTYGEVLWNCSFVQARAGVGAGLMAASVVTLLRGVPLLAFSMTHPDEQRQGFARALILESAGALRSAGHTELQLAVTVGNTAAERLYEALGFVDHG